MAAAYARMRVTFKCSSAPRKAAHEWGGKGTAHQVDRSAAQSPARVQKALARPIGRLSEVALREARMLAPSARVVAQRKPRHVVAAYIFGARPEHG